eukprot:CAMPEP_0113936594 /NCGR_PEP_ID=MMETSP1339-20121228/3474_1 /TAXON_ID=94617 /ORGANISM="Fibrocapsa japonica" /LENGTH=200 /DNA_ID=CAMNT_0000939125 /DNA_START=127 /DNA_END=729 /DNA_ORIENTATION=+ /assembly_acc=CAM_ASM_000762
MNSLIAFMLAALALPAVAFMAPTRFNEPQLQRGGAVFSKSSKELRMASEPSQERTYIMVKPDGVQRGLVGDIISRFEKRGFKMVALKMLSPPKALLEEHYDSLAGKPFFPKLMEYMSSGPVVGMVWEGKEVVSTGRKMLGATNPLESAPGTIRGDFCIEVGRNICHGSDSVENGEREIGLWFSEDELQDWKLAGFDWIYE